MFLLFLSIREYILWVVLWIFVEPLPYFVQDVAALDAEEAAPDDSDDCFIAGEEKVQEDEAKPSK